MSPSIKELRGGWLFEMLSRWAHLSPVGVLPSVLRTSDGTGGQVPDERRHISRCEVRSVQDATGVYIVPFERAKHIHIDGMYVYMHRHWSDYHDILLIAEGRKRPTFVFGLFFKWPSLLLC